jgi:hypothetical protein
MEGKKEYVYNPRGFMEELPNLSYVVSLVGDDFDFKEKFLAIIKHEFPFELGLYTFHIKRDEPRHAAEYVHKLKYRISALGMDQAFEFADKFEERLQTGDMSLATEFNRILKKIDAYLQTI